MALLYNVKIKTLDREKKSITVIIENIHPDALYFSDNFGFVIRLIHDSTLGDSNLAKAIDHNCLFSNDWMQNNVRAFISSSKLLQILDPIGAEIMDNGEYSFWRGEGKQALALLEINFTSENWFDHLTLHSSWKSTAYDLQVDFKSFDLNTIQTDVLFSMDYINSGGWKLFPAKDLFFKHKDLPSEIYVPKYSLKSYRKANKFTAKDINIDLITKLLYKTVYILKRNTEKTFGVLLPFEDKFCVTDIGNKRFLGTVYFSISDVFTICEAEFNQNDSFLLNVFE